MALYKRLTALKTVFVESDRTLSDAMLEFFRSKGCPVQVFSSAEKALQAMRNDRFDVIISDHSPPGLDGVAFLMQAKELQPHTIRILLTDYHPLVAPGWKEAAIHAGPATSSSMCHLPVTPHSSAPNHPSIDDVIAKPFTITELERSLQRLLEQPTQVMNAS